MTSELRCEEIRELAPEVALDIASGHERDAVLRHLTGCNGCRRLLLELSSVRDGVLLATAPSEEPRVGFERRLLEALTGPPTPSTPQPRRQRPWAVSIAAATVVVVAAMLGAVSVYLATASDRRLGEDYRATLEAGQGSFFAAAPLEGPQGRAGAVFGYQGAPSWVMVTLDNAPIDEQDYKVEIVTRGGDYVVIGEARLGGESRAWGTEVPVDLPDLLALRLIGPDGREVFVANFDSADPWRT